MVFVLKTLPHKRFARRGADLVHKVTLPLYQALVGASIDIQTLDNRCARAGAQEATGACLTWRRHAAFAVLSPQWLVHALAHAVRARRTLTVPIADIVTPGYSQVVPGEGLPKPTGGRGNLILEVELLFPTHVSETQKMLIRSAFFLPPTPSAAHVKALRAYESAFKDPLHGWAHCLPKEEEPAPPAAAKKA